LNGQTVVELGHQAIQIILRWSLMMFHCSCLASIIVVVRSHGLTVETTTLSSTTLGIPRVPWDDLGVTTGREIELLGSLRRGRDAPIVISFISS
jgi:hypothetical protein